MTPSGPQWYHKIFDDQGNKENMANFSITTVLAYGLVQMMSASQINSFISRTTVAANETG